MRTSIEVAEYEKFDWLGFEFLQMFMAMGACFVVVAGAITLGLIHAGNPEAAAICAIIGMVLALLGIVSRGLQIVFQERTQWN